MPRNIVLFDAFGTPWTVGALFVLLALLSLFLFVALLPAVARRSGQVRRMSEREAASYAMYATDNRVVRQEPLVSGPAVGAEWNVSYSVSDLRRYWQSQNYTVLFGILGIVTLFALSWVFGGVAGALFSRQWGVLVFSLGGVLVIVHMAYMLWAAVYTTIDSAAEPLSPASAPDVSRPGQ